MLILFHAHQVNIAPVKFHQYLFICKEVAVTRNFDRRVDRVIPIYPLSPQKHTHKKTKT